MENTPYYVFEDFRHACAAKKYPRVTILKDAMEDARRDFALETQGEVFAFIINGGLEQLDFINKKLWESNPDPPNPMMVDGYEFISLLKRGYIAFMHNAKTDYWIIKSLHISKTSSLTFALAFKKAGLIPGGEHE